MKKKLRKHKPLVTFIACWLILMSFSKYSVLGVSAREMEVNAVSSSGVVSFMKIFSSWGSRAFYISIIINAILVSLRLNKNKDWGIIYDAGTQKPIPFAVIRVFKGNGEIVLQRVSDICGRYSLILDKGTYKLEIAHSNYKSHYESIEIDQEGSAVILDISLVQEKPNRLAKKYLVGKKTLNDLLFGFIATITYITFFISFVFVIVYPTTINILLVTLAVLIFLLPYIVRLFDAKPWGTVIDSQREIAVPFASVRIFNPQTNNLEDVQVTDRRGRYGFLIDPGNYNLLVSAQGYVFPSRRQKIPEETSWKSNFISVNVSSRKTVSANLYIDPVNTSQSQNLNAVGTMKSPFSSH